MHDYTKAIHSQLQAETNRKKPVADKWLLKYLKGRIFLLLAEDAPSLCKLLKIPFSEPSYYKILKCGYLMNNGDMLVCHTSLIASQILESVHMDGAEIISQGVLLD